MFEQSLAYAVNRIQISDHIGRGRDVVVGGYEYRRWSVRGRGRGERECDAETSEDYPDVDHHCCFSHHVLCAVQRLHGVTIHAPRKIPATG